VTSEGEKLATLYHAHRQFAGNRNWALIQIVRTERDPRTLLPALRNELAALDAELVLHQPATLESLLGRGVAQQRFTTWLMTSFAGLAVLLASLGLFGVITFMVRQRRREIGIRAALGARPWQIRGMVLRQGLSVAAVGVAIGLVGAVAAGHLLRAVVFETDAADVRVLVAAAVAMAAVSALAAYLPAREATSIDPGTVLQSE
jgi:putative ABC transport system permease protein